MKAQIDMFGVPETAAPPNVLQQFEVFWLSFPNKKGKGDAEKAFRTAIKQATLDQMLEGIAKYVANKPDWQAYKGPGPWLRGKHWLDEWEPQQTKAPQHAVNTNHIQRYQTKEEYIKAELARAERSFR